MASAVTAFEEIIFDPRSTPTQVTPTPTKIKIGELKTATYIVRKFPLADQYEKVTKAIFWYIIQKMPVKVELSRGICNGILPIFLLHTKTKKEPVVGAYEYEIISYERNVTVKNKIEKRLYVEEINQKLFVILVKQCSKAM